MDNLQAGIEKMKSSEYAYLSATQSVYGKIGKSCEVIEMGPNLFNGILVIVWQKDFPYASLLNY